MSYEYKTLKKGGTIGSGDYVFRAYSESEPYVTFSSPTSFTLSTYGSTKNWDGTLQTSTDKSNWTTWGGTTSISSASDGTKHNIYIRGISNTYINSTDKGFNGSFIFNGSNISISGNIENLLDYATVEAGNHPPMASGCFACLFGHRNYESNTAIVDISSLTLPATTLTQQCYYEMFTYNTNLTGNLPELPALTIESGSYREMYSGCSSITRCMALPATTMNGTYCYGSMFTNCSNLETLPILPTVDIPDYAYSYMFYNCSKIKISQTKTGEYQTAFIIPPVGWGTGRTYTTQSMFGNTGGSFTGNPVLNTTYYTSNELVS